MTPRLSIAFLKSFLVAMSNPKYYVFMSAVLPQFVMVTQPLLQQYAVLAVVIAMIDLLVMFGYAMLGVRAVRMLQPAATKWLNRVSGVVLLGLAGSLIVYRRAGS